MFPLIIIYHYIKEMIFLTSFNVIFYYLTILSFSKKIDMFFLTTSIVTV